MTRAWLVPALLLLPWVLPPNAAAQRIEPGVRYQGETRLEAPEYGVSFVLPAGWTGVFPPDGEHFVMTATAYEAYILAGVEEMTVAEALDLMRGNIELGDGIRGPGRRGAGATERHLG